MNYYTGRANVSIPIYHTSERGVDLDVSLSYDTQGILATSLPGWTGHNWTLNVGGVITRVKNKLVDEYTYRSTSSFKNYFQNPGALKKYVEAYIKDKDMYKLASSIVKGDTDCEPDVFYFNFMGKSGRFFYGDDGQWKVYSDDNIHVEFDVNDTNNYILPYFKYLNYSRNNKQMKTIKGFTLIDDNGTRYIFGDNSSSNTETNGDYETRASAIEYSVPFFSALDDNTLYDKGESLTASAWYLTEIKDRFGNSLYKFTYERGKFMVQISYVNNDTWETYNGKTCPRNMYNFPYAMCLNSPVYLSKITMPLSNKTLKFTMDTGRVLTAKDFYPNFCKEGYCEKLKEQVLKSTVEDRFYFLQGNEEQVTRYQNKNSNKANDPLASTGISPLKNIEIYSNGNLIENYKFTYTTGKKQRLFMTAIDIVNGSSKNGSYRFSYNNIDSLSTDYLHISTDEWGYYNAGAVRSVMYLPATKLGMLTRIFYPTGGLSEFAYEQNSYTYYFDKQQGKMKYSKGEAGGLRIKSIKNYEDSTKTVLLSSKTYTYSDGELYSLPVHEFDWVPNSGNVKLHITNYNSIVPLCNSFGPHIGYSQVTETNMDGSYTKYEYMNLSSCMDQKPFINSSSTPSPYDEFTERGYKRGKLSLVTVYDNRNHCMNYTRYYYRTDDVESKFVYNTNLYWYTAKLGGNSAQGTYTYGGVYKMFYPKYDVVEVYSTTRYESKEVATITEYDKRDYTITLGNKKDKKAIVRQCLSTTETRGSSVKKTEYRYPNQESGTYSYLTSQFFLPVVSVKNYADGQLVGGNRTVYDLFNGKYAPKYEIAFGANESVKDTLWTYISYTSTFRPKEAVDGLNINHKYFWNDRDQLIGKVDNGSSNIKANASATSCDKVISSSNSSEVFGTSPTNIEACIYNNRGLVTSIIKGNALKSYYSYDSFSRLTSVKDNSQKTVQSYSYHYRPTISNPGSVKKEKDETYVYLDLYKLNVQQVPSSNTIKFDYEIFGAASNAYIRIYKESDLRYVGPKEYNVYWKRQISSIPDSRKGSFSLDVTRDTKDWPSEKYVAFLCIDGDNMKNQKSLGQTFTFTRYVASRLTSATFNSSTKTVSVNYTLSSTVKSASIELVSKSTNKTVLTTSLTVASSGSKSINVSDLTSGEYNVYLVADGTKTDYKTLTLTLPEPFPSFSGYLYLKKDTSKKIVTVYYQNAPSNATIKAYRNSTIASNQGIKAGAQYTQQSISSGNGSITFNYGSWPSDTYVFFMFAGGNDSGNIKGSSSIQLP